MNQPKRACQNDKNAKWHACIKAILTKPLNRNKMKLRTDVRM